MECFLLILNVAKLQFYLNMIAHRERWEKLLWPKDKCTVKSMTKVRRLSSNLFNLSSHCRRSYKTFSAVPWLFDCSYCVLCYFMLTPSKCCARNSQCKESWYQVFFRMTTSLPISISPITQHSHSCFLRMKLLLCTCTCKERCSAPELQFVVLLWYEN